MDELSINAGIIETGLFDPFVSVSRQAAACPATMRIAHLDQLALLHASGLITDDQLSAGVRWRCDWMAHAQAVTDRPIDAADPAAAVTAQLACLEAGVQCRHVRDGIGIINEMLLVMLIIDGNSPEAIGMKLYPFARHAAARDRWREGCITLIRRLTARYKELDQPVYV